jgi:hypothetical protein
MASSLELLLCKHKTLSSNFSSPAPKIKNAGRRKEEWKAYQNKSTSKVDTVESQRDTMKISHMVMVRLDKHN